MNEWEESEFESVAGVFAQGGVLDEAVPGPVLAAAVAAVADGNLSGLTENELMGIVSAADKAASWMEWVQTMAEAEYASRNTEWDHRQGREVLTEFAGQDLAQEIHLSGGAARGRLERSLAAKTRLPRCLALHRAGKINGYRLKIITETTAGLPDLIVGRADQMIADRASGRTPGSLRRLCQKIVMLLDPRAAEENRKRAGKGRRVEVVQEYSGNGMVSLREINPVAALTIKVTLDQWARIMREAGITGSLDSLRADAATALLSSRHPVTGQVRVPGTGSGGGGVWAGIQPEDQHPAETAEDPFAAGYSPWTHTIHDTEGSEPEDAKTAGPGPAAVITILVPAGLLDGTSGAPATIAGFGELGGDIARDLIAAASRNPATRWCVTKTGRDGRATGHACIAGQHQWSPPETGSPGKGPPSTGPPATGPPGTGPPGRIAEFIARLKPRFAPLARESGDDGHREERHDPSRKLTHLIQARNATCATPGCGATATFADMEHTIAWEEGGETSEHNLDPRCRHHHRLKQDKRWQVTKPAPGITTWTAPSGRTRTITPTRYLT